LRCRKVGSHRTPTRSRRAVVESSVLSFFTGWDLVPNTPTAIPFNLNGIDRPTGRHRLRAVNALAPGDRERERQALISEEGKGKRGEASSPDKISPYGPRRGCAFAASIDRSSVTWQKRTIKSRSLARAIHGEYDRVRTSECRSEKPAFSYPINL
jgi:hypothetical protein